LRAERSNRYQYIVGLLGNWGLLIPFLSFISFAPPKEMNKRKGVRKRQPHPICPPATLGLIGATKQAEVRTFSGFPRRLVDSINRIFLLFFLE
jgi:hypothetical protein